MARLRARPMLVEVATPDAHTVVVTVTHEDWQSYSRAVGPRATQEWRPVAGRMGGGTWHRVIDFDPEGVPLAPRRSRTRFTYTREA